MSRRLEFEDIVAVVLVVGGAAASSSSVVVVAGAWKYVHRQRQHSQSFVVMRWRSCRATKKQKAS